MEILCTPDHAADYTVARMVISNTGLPWRGINEPLPAVIEAGGSLAEFQAFAAATLKWEPWALLQIVMATRPSADVAAGQPHVILEGGGHFLQEDLPRQYTETLLGWLGDPS